MDVEAMNFQMNRNYEMVDVTRKKAKSREFIPASDIKSQYNQAK